MTNRFSLAVVLMVVAVALSACSGASVDFSGRWVQDGSTVNEGAYVTMNLTQSGSTVTGFVFAGAAGANVRGEASGNRVSLSAIGPDAEETAMNVNAQVNGGTMTGAASYLLLGGTNQTEFSLQKGQ